MNESPSMWLEALRIITEFISSNLITIVLLVSIIIYRNAISCFISRLTSFSFQNGNSKLGVRATAPNEENKKIASLHSSDEKPSPAVKNSEIEEKEEKEGQWFPEMHKAFHEGRLDDAEASFKKYALDEKDKVKLQENKALYLYFRFAKGKDNQAIGELEDLARTAITEDSKFSVLMWLSFCLRDSMQYKKEIEVWRSVVEETKSESLKTRAIVNLAYALNKEEASIEARKLLVGRLSNTLDDAQKTTLYEALSKIELSLGNKSISIYCKDKSLEFDANNRDELFNSAYAASDEDIDEISISNYIKLIRIDVDNSTALNNLGVRAQEAGLKIKAVDNYKKSSDHNNTLAMANQGYLLLDAGFSDEAEKIAKHALELEDPHQNVHALLTAINEKKEKEDKKWEELREKSLSRQKFIRKYTEQYYLGKSNVLEGDWFASDIYPTNITIENGFIKAAWIESTGSLAGGAFTSELIGKVTGSTISGKYMRKGNESSPNTLLGASSNTVQPCIGCVSDNAGEIKPVSTNLKDNFSLCLTRQ